MTTGSGSSSSEVASILAGLEEIKRGRIEARHPVIVVVELRQLWSGALEDIDVAADQTASGALADLDVATHRPARSYRVTHPDWLFGMTDEFRKAIAAVDRKLQGRILQAIAYIMETPVDSKGDTVKPLGGEFKDLWRYRIGDYRLVYRPDRANRQVMLVAFTSRGGAYE